MTRYRIYVIVYCSYTDPCSTTNYLNDWRRSVAFEIDTVQICDNILEEGWYRIISGQGDKMPTECPEYGFKCNTAIPIWLLNGNYYSIKAYKEID